MCMTFLILSLLPSLPPSCSPSSSLPLSLSPSFPPSFPPSFLPPSLPPSHLLSPPPSFPPFLPHRVRKASRGRWATGAVTAYLACPEILDQRLATNHAIPVLDTSLSVTSCTSNPAYSTAYWFSILVLSYRFTSQEYRHNAMHNTYIQENTYKNKLITVINFLLLVVLPIHFMLLHQPVLDTSLYQFTSSCSCNASHIPTGSSRAHWPNWTTRTCWTQGKDGENVSHHTQTC